MAAKILYFEDEPDLCALVKAKLESAGDYTVVVSMTAQGGEDIAAREMPDLILMDVVMPGRSGWDLAKSLKKKNSPVRRTPIVIISGKGEMIFQKKTVDFKWTPNNPLAKTREQLPDVRGAEASALAYGVEDFIAKPFRLEVLVEVVQEVLKRFRKVEKEEGKDDSLI